jgi:hypothetical protein
MPTLPTSLPHKYAEIRFPQELSELNNKPLRYFGEATGGMSFGNPFQSQTVNTMWHDKKREESNYMAMAGVRENIRKDAQMITAAKNRRLGKVLEGGCGMCENRNDETVRGRGINGHMNTLSPSTIEGANVLAGRGMHGGVMKTLAGAQYLRKRLTARIAELDTTDSDVNGVGSDNPNDVTELSLDDEIVVDLGQYLDDILESVATGYFDASSLASARGFLSKLLEGGWMIPSGQLVGVQRNLDESVVELEAAVSNKGNTYALTAEKKKLVRTMLTVFERARSVIRELVKNSYLSPKERKMVLQAYKPQLKKQLAVQVETQIPGRLKKERNDNVDPEIPFVDAGAFERTYSIPKRPTWYTSLGSIPGTRRLPRAVAERIAAR